ncbi:MAG: STAS domain-containing protein [Treponema sp.]|nr:STAS domain-containing protein [Treponema sp.]
MELKISKNGDDIYRIELSGAMDLYNSNQLKDSVMNIIKGKVESFVINLNNVDSINSAGIGALVSVASTLKKLKCPLVMVIPEGPVTQALEITRLRGYFTIAASFKEALLLCRGKKLCKEAV